MEQKQVNFDAFTFDKYFWIGRYDVAWLAPDSHFLIFADRESIPDVQRAIIVNVCNLPNSTRTKLEDFLLREYRSNIYGSYHGGDNVTPPLKDATEIWRLLSQPGIKIPPLARNAPDCYFAVTFECVWDPEHGLEILFNDAGEPIKIGQSGDHF